MAQLAGVADTHSALVIGAGLSGLCTTVALIESGVRDVVVLERGATVAESARPGLPDAPCDLPSLLYPHTFSPATHRPRWSGRRPTATEIEEYTRRLIHHRALEPLIRFGQDVNRLEYDNAGARWVAHTAAGARFAARSVVLALSPIARARTPEIRGLDRFAGAAIHTAEWDGSYDVTGKRVAVIGTGASAVQLIPQLAERAAQLKIFQRSPRWILPRPEHASSGWEHALLRLVGRGHTAARQAVLGASEPWALAPVARSGIATAIKQFSAAHLRREITDPWLRLLLTPTYRIGQRPTLVSSDYYPALRRRNTQLLHFPIATVSEAGIRTADALEHRLDCLILATGAQMVGAGTRFPIVGRAGRILSGGHTQHSGAYKGVTVAGFPNLFLIAEPGSQPGRSAALVYMDPQIDYAVRAITQIADGTIRSLDVRDDVQRTYEQTLRQRLADTIWRASTVRGGGHFTEFGFDSTVYPGLATEYRDELATVRFAEYSIERAPAAVPDPRVPVRSS